jgi:O-antigen/teichoic acid export membrane protein
MNTVQRLAKNMGMLIIAQIIVYALGLVISMYTTRYLGPEGKGILANAFNLTIILSILGDLGLISLMIREVSRDIGLVDKYLSNIMFIKFFLSFLILGATGLTLFFVKCDWVTSVVIYIMALSVIMGSFNGILFAIFQANEKMEYLSLSMVINSVLMFVGTFLCIFYELSVIYFAFLYLISNFLIFVYFLIVYIWNFSIPRVSIDAGFSKEIMITALPLAMASIASLIAFRIDTFMLWVIKGMIAVGYYSTAYNTMEVFLFIPGAFATAIFPIFSSLYVSSKDSLKIFYQKSFKYLMILSLPLALGITILAQPIVLLLYHSSFQPSILILQILIWSIPIIFLNYILSTIMPAMNREKLLVKITFMAMIFNIILNLIIIPVYSYVGAAVVTILTELLIFISCLYILNKTFHKIYLHHYFIKPAIASTTMAIFLIFLKLNLFIMIFLSIILYFTVLFLLNTFNNEDVKIIKTILKIGSCL